MLIKVLGKSDVTKEVSGKNSYFSFILTYQGDKGVQTKKVLSFTDVYPSLKDVNAGESYDVTSEKDANGYWQWTRVQKADINVPQVHMGGPAKDSYSADRQRSIVRQSSLSSAIAYLTYVEGGPDTTREDVLEVAERFESWVNRTE